MNVCFEIGALFHLAIRWGKRAAISKSTYIWTPSSRSYIVFALRTPRERLRDEPDSSETFKNAIVKTQSDCHKEYFKVIFFFLFVWM